MIAYVTRHVRCSVCGEAYGPDDVRVVLYDDSQWDLVATCPACHAQRLVSAYDQPPYVYWRSRPAAPPGPITEADMEAWAAFLAGFWGDMFDLLAEP